VSSIRDRTAIVGVGESTYYKWGQSPDPEFRLCLKAILAAVEDAGLQVSNIDGFASFSNDRNDAVRVAAALGIPELRHASMVWGGGGGGGSGAVAHAVAAVAGGLADTVVVYRALNQGEFGRFGQGKAAERVSGPSAFTVPYGLMSPAQMFAMRVRRFMSDHGVEPPALRAIAMASYAHAQSNPDAIMHGRPLTEERYDDARWIVEPFRLYDCCQENDGAAAVIVTSAERAADLRQRPAYVRAVGQGSGHRQGPDVMHNDPEYATSNFGGLARRLYETSGVKPKDIDVVQSYENFTGGVMMALVEHGFCAPDEVNEFLTLDNLLAPGGGLPLNTSGGNLAHCYMHGMELIVEAVRQVRGTAIRQVADADHSLVISGPMVAPVSNLLLGASHER
jgi:acetyl-CoA acetyltransferase